MTIPLNVVLAAKKAATRATHPEHKLGAVVFVWNTDKIIATGANTGWGFNGRKWGFHAEETALLRARPLKGRDVAIYVYRQNGDHRAWPCPDCMKQILNAGISANRVFSS